ncbi:glycosyltransferase family 2 protein [Proteiniphilum sp. X52]|uniref:glycosyltransferase family 2 protein n=1 Tax=Proteiniphilum sp. X52 TaxID=2382159 RepID=UPI000F09C9CA|nr:glycosyltransferase family 2 protein [Proteiniphilum sp. X52]RNC63283.1 glycosyltransferase family 2 protein [Proteiniphilum sp. X52]
MNKMPAPVISVLIPLYNSAAFIRETIDSVLAQTFSDFELLLMDDGSSDDTADIVRTYKDPRIRYERCPHDFVGTFNRGVDIARGKYVALLDHDDMMVPRRLQMQYDFMESRPDIVACGGIMRTFGKISIDWVPVLEYDRIILEYLRRRTGPVFNPTCFFRKEVIDKYNIRYRRGYHFAVDTKFWTDVVKIGKIENMPEILVWYRTSDTQTSRVTLPESFKSSHVIYQEFIDYLLSKLNDNEEIKPKLTERFMPAMKKLTELSLFTSDLYFLFMREIIDGLYQNGFLNLKEPLGL